MISVVVPLYNYACYIQENIESILGQSIRDWEMIIVDDGSSDDPLSVIRPYLSKKIQYIRLDKNKGYGNAKNVGIQASKGEYIVVLDADDLLTHRSLEYRLRRLESTEFLWAHAKAYEFSGPKLTTFKYKRRKSIHRLEYILKTGDNKDLWKSIHAQTVMVHREVYEKVGLYEVSLRSMGDKEMWARIINNVGPPIFVSKFVAHYRQHKNQMHRSKYKLKRLSKYKKIVNSCIKRRKCGDLRDVVRLS